eukprot:2386-Heterococcus_DN1.PRE.11
MSRSRKSATAGVAAAAAAAVAPKEEPQEVRGDNAYLNQFSDIRAEEVAEFSHLKTKDAVPQLKAAIKPDWDKATKTVLKKKLISVKHPDGSTTREVSRYGTKVKRIDAEHSEKARQHIEQLLTKTGKNAEQERRDLTEALILLKQLEKYNTNPAKLHEQGCIPAWYQELTGISDGTSELIDVSGDDDTTECVNVDETERSTEASNGGSTTNCSSARRAVKTELVEDNDDNDSGKMRTAVLPNSTATASYENMETTASTALASSALRSTNQPNALAALSIGALQHLVLSSGATYFGTAKNGQPHGVGTEQMIGGSTYTGNWLNGSKHGQGTLVTVHNGAVQSTYIGEFYNDTQQGEGQKLLASGNTYNGHWQERDGHITATGNSAAEYSCEVTGRHDHLVQNRTIAASTGSYTSEHKRKHDYAFVTDSASSISAVVSDTAAPTGTASDPANNNRNRVSNVAVTDAVVSDAATPATASEKLKCGDNLHCISNTSSSNIPVMNDDAQCTHAVYFTGPVTTDKKAEAGSDDEYETEYEDNSDNDHDDHESEHDEVTLPPPSTTLLDPEINKALTAAVVRQHWLRPALVQVVTSGKLNYANGSVYTGTIKVHIASDGTVSQGIAHGFGTTMKVSGSYHRGYYHEGAYEGYGEYTKMREGLKASKYQGDWAQSKRHGVGAETTSKGRCEGTWSNNKRDGGFDCFHGAHTVRVREIWKDGDLRVQSRCFLETDEYATSSCVSVRDVKLSTGEKYTGTVHVETGAPNGYGIAISASGSVYDGTWLNGARNYKGKQTVVDERGFESRYAGTFVNDERQGHGIEETGSDVYVGNWHSNKRHGEGILFTKYDVHIGSFVDGVQEGNGTLVTDYGHIYKGRWRGGVLHGAGELYIEGQEHAQHQCWDDGVLRNNEQEPA